MKHKPVLFLSSAFVLLLLSGCSKESTAEQEAQKVVTVPVRIAALQSGNMDRTVYANGQTEALRKESVLSPVAGTVTSLKFLEGAEVRPHDTLAVIETKESQAAIAGAEALVAAASTEQQKSEAQRALELAKAHQSRVAITTKLGGIVSARGVVAGALVSEGADLFSIIDPASIDFVAQVTLTDLKKIALGMRAQVQLPSSDGTRLGAVVSAISPQSDPLSQTVRVRLDFTDVPAQDRQLLKDGIAGAARIVTVVDKDVLLAPRRALLRNDETNTYTIISISSDSLSMSFPVSVVAIEDSVAEISGPQLRSGMPIVVEGNYALPDSTRVTIK
jgi:multidrug efflux pump subunit AcrA (membrane-fusion protein)